MTTRTVLLGATSAALLLTGCSIGGTATSGPSETDLRPATSLTAAGVELAVSAGLEEAPAYDVVADVEPATGAVSGTVEAELPVGRDADEVHLRYFAALPDHEARARVGEVEVDGDVVETRLVDSLLTVPLPRGHGERVTLGVPFRYTLPEAEPAGLLDALGGLGGAADVGLLSRHDDAVNLGHWFPLWVPAGHDASPDPSGFGDIGNFPAARIRLRLEVPEAWTVVDGGVRTGEDVADGRRTVRSEGYGMNDLVVSVLRGYTSASRTLQGGLTGVTVTAYAPEEDAAELDGVLEETATSLTVLSDLFVDYPWREFDVVSAPLGSGVGGMEWPGSTWIESSLFAGGVPGLGGLDDLLGGLDLEALGNLEGLDGLGTPGGADEPSGGAGGDASTGVGGMLRTLRVWTIAHEVGHEWWHILVGNDSLTDPGVDEPLAQYSACLVLRALPDTTAAEADALCRTHIDSGYEQMRMLGDPDAAVDQSTDEFDSGTQYAGVVYGKAAAYYLDLEERYGREEVVAALGAVTEEHAFDMLGLADLGRALSRELGSPDGFDAGWRRWMQQTHGDEDLDIDAGAGLGGLDGLGGLGESLPELRATLEDLLAQQ